MVVFFDIDGTLVDNKSQIIPESTVRAVEKLVDNGHIPVVNTGRPYGHIDPRIRAMAFQGWVCACGMDVRMDGKQLFHKKPDRELMRKTHRLVNECGMLPIYEAEDGIVIVDHERDGHPSIEKERRGMAAKGFTVMDASEVEEVFFQKLVTFNGPDCQRERFVKEMSEDYDIIFRDRGLLELVMTGCSKAKGMEILLNALGADRANTLAIGDSTNDLPMFRIAAHTACMGGGMEELMEQAEFVTDTVLNDGIEKALQHFGLI